MVASPEHTAARGQSIDRELERPLASALPFAPIARRIANIDEWRRTAPRCMGLTVDGGSVPV
jgi:hypothetical protein